MVLFDRVWLSSPFSGAAVSHFLPVSNPQSALRVYLSIVLCLFFISAVSVYFLHLVFFFTSCHLLDSTFVGFFCMVIKDDFFDFLSQPFSSDFLHFICYFVILNVNNI